MARCTRLREMVCLDWYRATMGPNAQGFKGLKVLTCAFFPLLYTRMGLLLGGDEGVILVTEGISKQIYETTATESVLELTRSTRDGNRFFLATTKGLASIRYSNGNWIDEGTLPDFKGEVRSIAEMPNGDLYFSTLSSWILSRETANRMLSRSSMALTQSPSPRRKDTPRYKE